MIKKVVAFDLDDTLYPEREYVLSGFKAISELARKQLGIKGFYAELIKTFDGGEKKRTFDVTLKRLGIEYDEILIKSMVDCYRAHFPDIKPYDDVVPTLQHLRRKYHLVLISDGYLQAQRNKVRALGIEQLFEKIIYTDEYGKNYWKPSTFPYQRAMEYFSAEGSECVYVGDNVEKDFIAPNQLGWLTIQIKREGRQYKDILVDNNCGPQVTIDSLTALKKVLEES